MKKTLGILYHFSRENEHDTDIDSEVSEDFKYGYTAAMNDIRWAICALLRDSDRGPEVAALEVKFAKDHDINWFDFLSNYTTIPCDCKEDGCAGWRCVKLNDPAVTVYLNTLRPVGGPHDSVI